MPLNAIRWSYNQSAILFCKQHLLNDTQCCLHSVSGETFKVCTVLKQHWALLAPFKDKNNVTSKAQGKLSDKV